MVPFYQAANEFEADRLVAILNQRGLKASHYANQMAALPVLGGQRFVILVDKKQVQEATDVIHQCLDDQVISTKGVFL